MKIYTTFEGGYKFKIYEGQPSLILVEDKLPERVIMPMRRGFEIEAGASVKEGDHDKRR